MINFSLLCGYSNIDEKKLEHHKKVVHQKVHNYICHVCTKTFGCSRAQLRLHLTNAHGIGEKEHKCDQCSKAYSSSTTLKQHKIQVHTKIKSFVCEECGWASVTKNKLDQHINEKHTHAVVYPCEHFDYKAYRKGWLTTHVKNKHTN